MSMRLLIGDEIATLLGKCATGRCFAAVGLVLAEVPVARHD
jgi:hypothetical protein